MVGVLNGEDKVQKLHRLKPHKTYTYWNIPNEGGINPNSIGATVENQCDTEWRPHAVWQSKNGFKEIDFLYAQINKFT